MAMTWFPNSYGRCKGYVRQKKVLFCTFIAMSLCTYATFMMLRHDVIAELESTSIKAHRFWSNINIATRSSRGHRGKDVLLFGYMRAGTTLVGDFYRNSPGIFYVFEPLQSLAPYHYFTDHSVCNMRNAACEVLDNTKRILEAISTISNIYSCNIREVPKIVIDNILSENKSSEVWWDFGKCLNASHETTNKNKLQCFDDLEQACQKAEVKVLKILRLSFLHMRFFLQNFPNLHVLFLLRDPRAILNSRINTDWFPVTEDDQAGLEDNVHSFCKKMYHDIVEYEKTRSDYSDRMWQLNIENITENEVEMMKLLHYYRHDYKMQIEDRKYLDFIFMKKRQKRLFGDWRHTLKSDLITYTDQNCSLVLSYLDKHTPVVSPADQAPIVVS